MFYYILCIYIYIYIHTYISSLVLYIYIYVCVCACVTDYLSDIMRMIFVWWDNFTIIQDDHTAPLVGTVGDSWGLCTLHSADAGDRQVLSSLGFSSIGHRATCLASDRGLCAAQRWGWCGFLGPGRGCSITPSCRRCENDGQVSQFLIYGVDSSRVGGCLLFETHGACPCSPGWHESVTPRMLTGLGI